MSVVLLKTIRSCHIYVQKITIINKLYIKEIFITLYLQ